PPDHAVTSAVVQALENHLRQANRLLNESPVDLDQCRAWLEQLDQQAIGLVEQVMRFAAAIQEVPDELLRWTQQFADQVRERREELDSLSAPSGVKDLQARCQRLAD